ncbi:hypothetical protein [Prosthecobacter sp.]|uniref:hypothetical protein n=1 Tax=Prosthecobacter sp. TaxID=1965333 RepID=UPI003783601C
MNTDKPVRISCLYLALWFLSIVTFAFLALQVEANRITRLSTVGLILELVAAFFTFIWSWKRPRKACLAAMALIALLLVCPWKIRTYPETLRASYVKHLRTFEGCPYYWGGESRRGIDCSGLIRRGLIDACLSEGVVRLDPGLIRHGLSLWWHDTSAKALGEEHQGLTKRLFEADALKTLDYSKLRPGDVAVTQDGVHTMAYLGEETWIEADPGKLRVITVHAPTTSNGWFLRPVRILRWRMLGE